MNTALAYRKPYMKNKVISTYQQNEILNLNPTELILRLYDLALVSIKKNDISKANKVITELISALNFDYQEISLGLFRLYRYCQDCLYKNKFDESIQILEELRNTWAKAFNLS
ncbi:MAG: flagellar protein FliS [Calditrichia bacterium]